MTPIRSRIQRLARIIEVRQIAVAAAEARVRDCEREMRTLEAAVQTEEGRILQAMEEFAHPAGGDGFRLQNAERVARAARERIVGIQQDIEKTSANLEERLAEWGLARQEKRSVEKLRERQLQKAVREEAALMQKMIDEASVTRHVRKTRA